MTGDEPRPEGDCPALVSSEFEDVVSRLERSHGIPLCPEVARCSPPVELVAPIHRR
ncbi:hypothetical protein SAMN05660642_01027 [Geodermatophilus siccatus]|uniref:Uncharacterized protein n=1 Tax=Geodermatophilus siccatus TaxID=1137991 RepID=A0A1G9NGN1_9ACTN|nr:hypothetical protein SAMN05660642_01027 [Geodermatophilus siccatus]